MSLTVITRELSHRIKNVFADVQAPAKQTNERVQSVKQYREAFLSRLHALATIHSLMFDTTWQRADLALLLERMLEPHRMGRSNAIELDGEPPT